MRRYDKKQEGMTFLGLLVVAALISFFAYLGIRLVPVYMEYFNVTSSLKSLASKESQDLGAGQLRENLLKHLEINDVKHVDRSNIKIERDAGKHVVTVAYDVQQKFYGNVYLLVMFDESVTIPIN